MSEPRVDRPYTEDGYGIPDHLDGTLPWAWAEVRLRDSATYWVATVRPDGRPHVTPIWAVWVDGSLWMEGGQRTRRFKNLSANPAAVVTIERDDDALILEGDADLVTGLTAGRVQRLLAGYAKYRATHGYEAQAESWREGIWRITPRKVLGWSSFPTDATRWTFGG